MDKSLKLQVAALIDSAVTVAVATEMSEKAAGKILEDNPLARLLAPLGSSNIEGDGVTHDTLELSGELHGSFELAMSETTYLTTRRMWKAYPEARKLAGDDDALLYELFHFLPGVAALVEHKGNLLVGVRSASLGGTHVGMVSVPAGLMHSSELVLAATLRELQEETGIREVLLKRTAAGDNPDAPNVTFLTHMFTDEEHVAETFEAKGKRFFWMPQEIVLSAVLGNGDALAAEFAKKGIQLEGCRIAPDIASGIKQVFAL